MREYITIKNVGPLLDIDMPDIKPLTILIGESASGKSTLMKVIALMRYVYKMVNIRSYLKNAHIDKSPFRLNFSSMLRDNGLMDFTNRKSEIKYGIETDGQTYEIIYKNDKLNARLSIPNKDLVFSKGTFISENRNIIPSWAAKVSTNKGAKLGFYFHETFSDFDAATEAIKELPLGYMNLKLEVKKEKSGKKYVITPTDESYSPIDLKYGSSGIQTSTPIMVIARYFSTSFSFKDAFRRSVLDYLYEGERLTKFKPEIELGALKKVVHIHIEEPELSLYPDVQCKLVDDLIKQVFINHNTDRDMRMMIATHSPYILNYMNVLLKAGYHKDKIGDATYIDADSVAAYKISDGQLSLLNAINNETGEMVINTIDLSEQMDNIYTQYCKFNL